MTEPNSSPPTRVFLVEDDPAIATIAQQGMEDLGYAVIGPYAAAEDAIAALPKIHPPPDVVLMDINLNGAMDGIEAAEIIGRDFGLPVVYASALQDQATLD